MRRKKKENFEGILDERMRVKEVKGLDDKRKGEIAYILWKTDLKRKGVAFGGLRRDIGNIAKMTGISQDELRTFWRFLLEEIIKETLG